MGVPCNFMPHFDRRLVKTSEFSSAVAYALSCLRQELKDKEGNDVFAWFLTGYGKFVCYQLLPFMFDYKFKRVGAPALD